MPPRKCSEASTRLTTYSPTFEVAAATETYSPAEREEEGPNACSEPNAEADSTTPVRGGPLLSSSEMKVFSLERLTVL